MADLYDELIQLGESVKHFDRQIQTMSQRDEICLQLQTIPGIGVLSATALVAAVGNATAFKSGRELAAWLGLVPRQQSTGGHSLLLGIGTRGNAHLRTLLIRGARSVLHFAATGEE